MAKFGIKVEGVEEVVRNFEGMIKTANPTIQDFLNTTGKSMVDLLRANTPVDTGELRDSWRYNVTIGGGRGLVRATVTEDQEAKLKYIIFGTQYIQPNPFTERVEVFIQSFVANILGQKFDNAHKWYRESGFTNELKRANIGKIPGAGTGTNYSKRRSAGSFGLKRPSKGFKTLQRRVGRKSRRLSGL